MSRSQVRQIEYIFGAIPLAGRTPTIGRLCMGACKDPRLTYLNELGYNVVRLPSKLIAPLGIIGRDSKSRTWLGTLEKTWKTDAPVPAIGAPQEVGDIKGQKTSEL